MVSKFIPSKFQKPSFNFKPSQQNAAQPKAIQEFKESVLSGIGPFHVDYSAIAAILDIIKEANSLDDRKMFLEQMLVLISHLPPGKFCTTLTHAAVELLYNDLPHPPITNVGNQHAWRAADGAGNNPNIPDLGRAGTSYARSVQQGLLLPRHMLPDPGLAFDALLKRDKFVAHPAGLSSLMFSFAALVIHTVFRTNHNNVNINETSSYVDLAPLYGVNAHAQKHIRIYDGRGLLHPDTFSEDRLLLLPPAVPGLLILFNRNHNFIARKLLEINERGTWKDPDSIPSDDLNKTKFLLQQEEEIFQISRLINCGWFGSIVFSDYFSSILGLVRQGNSWSLDVFSEFRKISHDLFERGRGNSCSVEFNCLYRWHATTSKEDEEWTNRTMAQQFPTKKPDDITPQDFIAKMDELKSHKGIDMNVMTFGNLQRQANKLFPDNDLANLLKNATEHPAHKFGARGTPESMRWIEVMGIEAARRWGCCSLNDFRRFLGLKPYATFNEWNSNEEVADAAEKLYHDIESLELYVGLQAEDTKPVVPGAGLCPGYTASRAILADAVALIRGDRYFTADYTPHNLTAWGFADCQRSGDNAGFGSMLGRLLLRTLPTEYTEDSIYTWFPLMTPPAMNQVLTDLDMEDKYDFSRPSSRKGVAEVKEYGEVAGVLANTKKFQDPFLSRVSSIIPGSGFFLATSNLERGEREQRDILRAIAGTPEQVDAVAKYFYDATRKLIARRSYTLVGGKRNSIDIVRDVLKVVPIQWVAQLAGIQLKENARDDGEYTVDQLFNILADAYSYFFDNVESSLVLKLGEKVQKDVKDLLYNISGGKAFSLSGLFGTVSQFLTLSSKSARQEIIDRLQQGGGSNGQSFNSILAIMVGASVELAEVLTHMVNMLLDDASISKALDGATSDDSVLQGYISEVFRMDPPVQGVYRESKADETVGTQALRQKQLVFLNLTSAGSNERAFVNASTIEPKRSRENVIVGDILTRTLGRPLVSKIMIQVLRAVLELDGVSRGPGESGALKRFSVELDGMSMLRYLNHTQHLTPWAQSMVIQYNA